MGLWLAGDPRADALLERNPFALLVGMVLDQQVPMEKAFRAPALLADRLGVDELDAAHLASEDPEHLVRLFAQPPALHRFPRAMAERVHRLAQVIVEEYGGDAEALWRTATTGRHIVDQLARLPGFGPQKAKIFLAFLGKQRGVHPRGWRSACDPYGADGSYLSIADVVDAESREKVRAAKKEAKKQMARTHR